MSQKKHHRFYRWYFRVTSAFIIILFLSILFDRTKEQEDCDILAEETLKFYDGVVDPSIELYGALPYSFGYREAMMYNLNQYLNMSKSYFECIEYSCSQK